MKKFSLLALAALLILSCMSGCTQPNTLLDAKDPVALTMWHVYGEQADSPMNRLVAEFNQTVGAEKGIVINVTLMTNSYSVGQQLMDAQAGVPGALSMPDLFFCHANNAVALGAERLIDWNTMFSEEELSQFVDGFLADGMADGRLAVFPVSKSTHLLFVNGTQFARFSADTGVTYEDLATWDGFFAAAEKFYAWSGGKPFCAFDHLLRCVELNAFAQGGSFYDENGWYDFGSEALRRSWMQFAEALAQGHIAVSDMYSNTQVMTGETIAGLGSSAAILYYNDIVTYPDNTTEPTDLHILPLPRTAGGDALMTQAGVGLCAYKTTDAKAEAAAVFVRWLTEEERNLAFVADTGYIPVRKGAFARIEDFAFDDAAKARLYEALSLMTAEYLPLSEPAYTGYYDKVNRLYSGLRELQKQLKQRSDSGEGAAQLAEETWQLFQTIK